MELVNRPRIWLDIKLCPGTWPNNEICPGISQLKRLQKYEPMIRVTQRALFERNVLNKATYNCHEIPKLLNRHIRLLNRISPLSHISASSHQPPNRLQTVEAVKTYSVQQKLPLGAPHPAVLTSHPPIMQ